MVDSARKRRPYAARMPLAERRTQLLDAALVVIDRDGYDKVTVDAIAREAGVTRPVVYGAFRNLEELLMTLLDRQQARGIEQIRAAAPADMVLSVQSGGRHRGSDPSDSVHAAVMALFHMVQADPLTWRPIVFASLNAPEVVRQRVGHEWENIRLAVQLFITSMLPTGSDVDPEVASHIVLASLEHLGRVLVSEPDRFTAEQLAGTATALIVPVSEQ